MNCRSPLEEDKQLIEALRASQDTMRASETCRHALEQALELSQRDAEEEEEAWRHAVEASLAETMQEAAAASEAVAASEAAPEVAADIDAAPSHMLKVTYEHDVRRLRAQWPTGMAAPDVLSRVRAAVEEGFGFAVGFSKAPEYVLKYYDDEGDICTLVEDTLVDFLDVALQGNCLKLILQAEPYSKKLRVMDMFSLATPCTTPRSELHSPCSFTLEDDYESWTLVET